MSPDHPRRKVLVVLLTSILGGWFLSDPGAPGVPSWQAGDVADRDVVVRQALTVPDEEGTRVRQQDAEDAVPPVYEVDLAATRRIERRIAQAFDMARRRTATPDHDPAAIRADFVRALEAAPVPEDVDIVAGAGFSRIAEDAAVELVGVGMQHDVVADRSAMPPPAQPVTLIVVSTEGTEERALDDHGRLRTLEEARQAVSLAVVERHGGSREAALVRAAGGIARAVLAPNVHRADAITAERRALARAGVGPTEQFVRRGTRIVAEGDVVTARQVRLLEALAASSPRSGGWAGWVTWSAVVAVMLVSAGAFAHATIRKFTRRANEREALCFVLLLVLGAARGLAWTGQTVELPDPFDAQALALLVPVAGGAMLVRVLVNSESALVWALVASVLSALVGPARDPALVVYHLATALIATRGIGQARERLVVLRAGLQAGGLGVVVALLLAMLRAQQAGAEVPEPRAALALAGVALVSGVVSAVLSLGIVPAFELFGFVTDHKLHELASLNHPLLRQLMLRAPGTYHHSVIVGSLAEAACEAIGANALLARVACYFHDIGKGVKPQYFVENQREGPSRHERLSPEASAAVIIAHVHEGAALARQHDLPRAIVDNIFMHHGTGLIAYFHGRAQEGADGPVDDRPFRYPGPKPDSREAGVIMLADKVEAACRTIQQPTEERIRAMIQQVVNGVMNDGQLEECPLTVRELHRVAETFTNVLMGIHHHRIEYPATRAISSGKLPPQPRQGTITLEILSPHRPPPLGHTGPDHASLPPGVQVPEPAAPENS